MSCRRTLLPTLTALLLAAAMPARGTTTAFHLEIADSSAYRVSWEMLAAVAPGLGEIESGRLRLSVGGQPRAVHVDDGGDGRFGPGDHLSFFGERLHGPESWFDTYAVHNVYRLEIAGTAAGPQAVGAVASRAAAPLRRTLHLEEENLQIRLSNTWVQPGEEPDLWFWAKLTQIDPEPFQATFALPDLADPGTVRLRLGFRGLSEVWVENPADKPDDHVVEIRLNGEAVASTRFQSRNLHEVRLELPARALRATGNRLELLVPQRQAPSGGDALVDVVMFNALTIDYPITGHIDDTPLPITVASDGEVALDAGDAVTLVLYGRDGRRVEGSAGADGRWRFGALAAGEYQPVPDDGYATPARVRLAAPAAWREVDLGYDYLMIGHGTLLPEVAALAQHYTNMGMRVARVDVEHLYDEFNHGVVHPRAIRDFIAHAWHRWPAPRPRFVLLVGDASFDIRSDRVEDARYAKWATMELLIPGQFGEIPGEHYQGTDKIGARRNLVPTWQYPSEEGHSASDNYFVAIDGDDWLPDLAIGRFPVVEPAEVAEIVAKSIRYYAHSELGDWRRRTLFATDTSTYLQQASDGIASGLQAEGFQPLAVYPSEEERDNEAHIGTLKQAINEGQLLVHFIGHGGRYIWRTGPPDLTRNHDLFTLDHVANLDNAGRLPMVLSMTCYSAPFDHPSADSIGERFLREPNKGAIAVFAASWRNTPIPQFSQAAIDELMVPGAHIGEALMRAKRTLPQPGQRTLVETYNLLGDPAVVLQRPSLPIHAEPAMLALRPHLAVTLNGAGPVNGRVVVEWQDQDGATLARSRREMRGSRIVMPAPKAAASARMALVHVVDFRGRREGLLRSDLRPDLTAAAEAAAAAAAAAAAPPPMQPRTQPRPAPVSGDEILYDGEW